ncbi:hypothetical protein OROGR_010627 [Orobanche gracilis]
MRYVNGLHYITEVCEVAHFASLFLSPRTLGCSDIMVFIAVYCRHEGRNIVYKLGDETETEVQRQQGAQYAMCMGSGSRLAY